MKNIILFGAPGAGKGTQSTALVEKYNLKHISTGEILRKEMKDKTDLGLKAKDLIENGILVPDEIIIGMIENIISNNKNTNGFIFDGFPRTEQQAVALDQLLEKNGTKIDMLIELSVPDEMVVERLLLRQKLEGRADDNPESIKKRLEVYHTQTVPIAEYYHKQGVHIKIDATGEIKQVTHLLFEKVDAL